MVYTGKSQEQMDDVKGTPMTGGKPSNLEFLLPELLMLPVEVQKNVAEILTFSS